MSPSITKLHLQSLMLSSEGQAILFVGADRTPFVVSREAIARFDLSQQIEVDTRGVHYLDCEETKDINPKYFAPVAEYLQTGDFKLGSVDENRSHDDSSHAETLGFASQIARMLRLKDLQQLVAGKIHALRPLHGFSLLLLVKIIFSSPYDPARDHYAVYEIRDHLIMLVFQHFYSLMENHCSTMRRVLCDHNDLATGVYGKLASTPTGGI